MLAVRRPRMHRTASRKPLALTERDTEVLRCLTRYRYLRSTYLHAFVGGASEKRFIERLCDLFHHGLIARAPQQWQNADARCQPLVYEAERRGLRSWSGDGDTTPRTYLASGAHRQFTHALATCECLASIELAIRRRDDLCFIPWSEILARAPEATQRSPTPFRLATGPAAVIPDALFGIEYRLAGRKAYRFFALELDRGTMPVVRQDPTMTSVAAKLAMYGSLIANNGPRVVLGVPNLFVLTVTSGLGRLKNIASAVKADASAPWLLFKAIEESALRKPLPCLLTDPWPRAELPPLSIAESE